MFLVCNCASRETSVLTLGKSFEVIEPIGKYKRMDYPRYIHIIVSPEYLRCFFKVHFVEHTGYTGIFYHFVLTFTAMEMKHTESLECVDTVHSPESFVADIIQYNQIIRSYFGRVSEYFYQFPINSVLFQRYSILQTAENIHEFHYGSASVRIKRKASIVDIIADLEFVGMLKQIFQ